MSESRQKLLLAGLLVVLLAVVGLRVLPSFGGGDRWWLQGTTRFDIEDSLDVEILELRSSRLAAGSREFEIGRDLWRYGARPQPPAPKPPPPRPKPKPRPEPVRVDPTPAPVATQGPRPPAVDVTFLGTFGPNDRKIAVFFDGDSIYNAGRGDVINEKFQVVEIGLESVDLGFVGFPDEPPARLAIGG